MTELQRLTQEIETYTRRARRCSDRRAVIVARRVEQNGRGEQAAIARELEVSHAAVNHLVRRGRTLLDQQAE